MKSLTILEWKDEDRPREKFMREGAEHLSDAELLAMLLGSGTKKENVVELARRILQSAGNSLNALRHYSLADFKKFSGVGESKALAVMAAFELGKRIEMEKVPQKVKIYSSREAASVVTSMLKDKIHEECWVLYLNVSNRLIAKEMITTGGISATVIDMRLIIKRAFEKLASAIILVHNHPSGNVNPSDQDSIQTAKLKEAVKFCDIKLLDHIIVAGNSYFSFADEGLL